MASHITQTNRLLRINTQLDKRFGQDALSLIAIDGEESLSDCFHFKLETLCDKSIEADDLNKLLNTHATVAIQSLQGDVRYFHGQILTLQHKYLSRKVQHIDLYLVPYLYRLQQHRQQRTYFDQSIPDLIHTILKTHHINQYDLQGLRQTYSPIPYEVQNGESDYDFLQRLMQQAGIYFYFDMQADHHQLRFVDDLQGLQSKPQTISYSNSDPGEQHIHQWQPHVGQTAVCGHFLREQWPQHQVKAASNVPSLHAGSHIKLQSLPLAHSPTQYYVVNIKHRAHDHTHTVDQASAHDTAQAYSNSLIVVADSYPFAPQITVQTHNACGLQPALIAGKEIAKATMNDHGEYVTELAWPRGVRTAAAKTHQVQSGPQWGSQFLGRSGDEVLLSFDHGYANTPVIMGHTYNAENKPPYALPDLQYTSGWRSRTDASLDQEQGNELRFNDAKGNPSVNVTAQRDFVTKVAKDSITTVANSARHTVKSGDMQTQVGHKAVHFAGDKLVIKGSGGYITMTPNMIDIRSSLININPGLMPQKK